MDKKHFQMVFGVSHIRNQFLGCSRSRQVCCVRRMLRLVCDFFRCASLQEWGLTCSPDSVPLCYVYPAMLHYRACARTTGDKMKDIAMIIFGIVVFVYTTVETIRVCFPSFQFFEDGITILRLVDGRASCTQPFTQWSL